MGDGSDADVGIAVPGKPHAFSGQELQVAVRPHVDEHICTEDLLKIAVGGHVLMRGRHIRVVQDLADLAVAARSCAAAFGLDADYGIAILNARDHDLALVEHGCRDVVLQLAGRIAPGLADAVLYLGRERVKPALILLFGLIGQDSPFGHDLLDWSPAELGDGFSAHDGLDQLFASRRSVFQRIAGLRHPVHDSRDALDCVQVRAAADGRFNRGTWVVVEDEGHTPLGYRLPGQVDPFLNSF
ncbi:MAG: hypothetical protein A4E44_01601 [Methanosaeta sp. PtaB.Bin018]|nr:MAG: hypothetical protein A4E44_01601 [Methanosaeta sp. PtaB.Bin018]